MKISTREAVLMIATGTIVLFGVTLLAARPSFGQWRELRAQQDALRREIGEDRRLVEQRERWADKLAEVTSLLPQHEPDKKMDVYWLSVIDDMAQRHGLKISKSEAGEERLVGDLYELPIEIREWEGTLDALVHFLFELQREGVMLDTRQLLVRPKGKQLLRGRMSIYCAYTRKQAGEQPDGNTESGILDES